MSRVVERIEDAAGFEKLGGEWNELLAASDSGGLFLTWEWLYTWWKHFGDGRRLCLVTVRRDGRLEAIAPLALRPPQVTRLLPFRAVEFLGTGNVGSDYLDVIVRRGSEETAVAALADHLARERLMLDLSQLRRGSCVATRLAEHLVGRGWTASEAATDVCPFVHLAGHSWQSYLETLGSEHRYNLRRRLRKANERSKVRLEQAVSDEQRREALAVLVELHNRRWRERGGSTALHTPALQAFHEELSLVALERGWLRLFVLRFDTTPVAAIYGFKYDRVAYFYQAGFDLAYAKQSVGLITLGLFIKSVLEEGVEECDLLHGDEGYKSHWTPQWRELARLELYPPAARGLFYRRAVGFSRAARRTARRVLQLGGAA